MIRETTNLKEVFAQPLFLRQRLLELVKEEMEGKVEEKVGAKEMVYIISSLHKEISHRSDLPQGMFFKPFLRSTTYEHIGASEKYKCDDLVAILVAENFKKIPSDIRNTVLHKVSMRESAAGAISWTIAENYSDVPKKLKEILNKLSEREQTADAAGQGVVSNLDKIPVNSRNKLLLKLSQIRTGVKHFGMGVLKNIHTANHLLKKAILNLAQNEDTALQIAVALSSNMDTIPIGIRRQLLERLCKLKTCQIFLAWVIAGNFGKLSKKEKEVIKEIEEPMEELLSYLSNTNGEETLRLIMNVFRELNLKFTSDILHKLYKTGNEIVKEISGEMLALVGCESERR